MVIFFHVVLLGFCAVLNPDFLFFAVMFFFFAAALSFCLAHYFIHGSISRAIKNNSANFQKQFVRGGWQFKLLNPFSKIFFRSRK